MFFFWILIYIEKEEKMKISCNRVSEDFCWGGKPRIYIDTWLLNKIYFH